MLLDLDEISYETFTETLMNMPTEWLLNYYRILYTDNEHYHSLIDIILDMDSTLEDDSVVDKQIECFNRLIAIGNVLRYRDVPIPNLEIRC
jgi:hypothetical protein